MTKHWPPGTIYQLREGDGPNGSSGFSIARWSTEKNTWVFNVKIGTHRVERGDMVMFLGIFTYVLEGRTSQCVAFLHEDCICGVNEWFFLGHFEKVKKDDCGS